MRKRSILILVLAAGFVGLVFYSLFQAEPVQVLRSRLERSGSRVAAAGTVENTSSGTAAVGLEVRYYDAGGRTLAEDAVKIRGLKSGEARDFRAPERNLPEAAGFSIYLNHGLNPYGN